MTGNADKQKLRATDGKTDCAPPRLHLERGHSCQPAKDQGQKHRRGVNETVSPSAIKFTTTTTTHIHTALFVSNDKFCSLILLHADNIVSKVQTIILYMSPVVRSFTLLQIVNLLKQSYIVGQNNQFWFLYS